MNLRRSPMFWAFTLGAVGGAAGFFGPIFLNPDANQGPLVGLFITGPGGALAGAILGFFFRILPFSDQLRTQALTFCCLVLGLGTLFYVLPEPEVKARIIEASIGRCRPADELLPARIAHWEERVAAVTYAEPRAHWRDDTRRMLRDSPGVIVELHVSRRNTIVAHRKPWNRGRIEARGWTRIDDTERYFGGGTCASYPAGRQVLLMPTSDGPPAPGSAPRAWPPDDLPGFLGVQTLEAVPAEYRQLIASGAGHQIS